MNNKQHVRGRHDARSLALETLIHIFEEGAYANIAVNEGLQRFPLKGPERGLFTELVYGTTRTRNTLDWALAHFLKKDLAGFTPAIRNLLRLGAYQLLYLERVPARAVVHRSVELAKRYGHQGVAGLVNGVLRNLIRRRHELVFPDLEKEPVQHIALKYSHPQWLVSRWVEEYGIEATIELCRYNNSPAPLTLRVNTLKITREELVQKLARRGIEAAYSRYVPEGLVVEGWPGLEEVEEFQEGLFLMQDESSMLVAHALKPRKGALVIDACAAPGTKTTHLAQLMEDTGQIIAIDVHEHKLDLIRQNCRRLGIGSVKAMLGDARDLNKFAGHQAGYVLVDAPCSGLGVLGRRADARWRKTPEGLAALTEMQLAVLQGGAAAVAEGGVLVYSTCSIAPEENRQVVEHFLAINPDFEPEDLTGVLPGGIIREEQQERAKKGILQILPQLHGIDGFFIARLRKKRGAGV
ncbi:MAG: 16S rRNA (cytosine(967)-C(5))-methyltransferase RsmB [Clostridia bacterium]|nr:16S rRNA (cytosine(967)-C(5))-methyltransferase RsmB [Clostridia bacterium]